MRVVVVGATGNVGTSTVAALAGDPAVAEIVGVARRLPERPFPKLRWVAADIRRSELVDIFRGADVVIHLGWLIQPSRRGRAALGERGRQRPRVPRRGRSLGA